MWQVYTVIAILFAFIISIKVLQIISIRKHWKKVNVVLENRFGTVVKVEQKSWWQVYVYTGKQLYEVELSRQFEIKKETMLVG